MIKPSLRVFCPSCLYIPFCITRWNCQISISTLQQLWWVLFFVFEVIFSNFWEILSNLIQNNFLWEKTCKLQANSLLVGTLILTKFVKLTKLVISTKLVTFTNLRHELVENPITPHCWGFELPLMLLFINPCTVTEYLTLFEPIVD